MKLVVLTKSAKRMNDGKRYGNCVAGINERGEWVRLVSDFDGDSLSDNTCRPFDCLDIIDVEVTPCPLEHHPENVKLEHFNERLRKWTIGDVVKKFGLDNERFCFVNKYNSLNDIERHQTEKSLILIKVEELKIYLDDRKSYKAQFYYNGFQYEDISVTDNRYRKPMIFDEAYLVVSLPSDTGGYKRYYKFIAAIYPI